MLKANCQQPIAMKQVYEGSIISRYDPDSPFVVHVTTSSGDDGGEGSGDEGSGDGGLLARVCNACNENINFYAIAHERSYNACSRY